jgi:sterol 3beta-glucosyltransferase
VGIQTWGSDGDIRPFVALANGLARAGHQVTLAVTSIDGKDYSVLCTGDNPRIIRVAHRDWEQTVILGTMRELLKARDVFRQLRIVLTVFFVPSSTKCTPRQEIWPKPTIFSSAISDAIP